MKKEFKMHIDTPDVKKTDQAQTAEKWVGIKPKRNQLNVNMPDDFLRLFQAKIKTNNLANKENVTMADIVRKAIQDYCDK
jgi:hypothetical protein